MHPGQALVLAACIAFSGCAVMMNGMVTHVHVKRDSPDVKYLVDGVEVAPDMPGMVVFNNRPHKAVAIAADGSTAEMVLEQEPSWAGVALDVLCSLTIIGLAAPLSDVALNSWFHIAPDHVALVPSDPAPKYVDLGFDARLLPRMAGAGHSAPGAPTPVVPAATPKKKKTQ